MEGRQTILYLFDGDLVDRSISVRVPGGLRAPHLAHDLAFLERRARLIIEQYKAGSWEPDDVPQMPRGYGVSG